MYAGKYTVVGVSAFETWVSPHALAPVQVFSQEVSGDSELTICVSLKDELKANHCIIALSATEALQQDRRKGERIGKGRSTLSYSEVIVTISRRL